MLWDAETGDIPRPYWDPVLGVGRNRNYIPFFYAKAQPNWLSSLHSKRETTWERFVHKTDRRKIRLINDARSTNAMLRDPQLRLLRWRRYELLCGPK